MAILSIQSHVAYGYVGNRAANFPLQRLGYDVWSIHTVQFSNHTGYGKWTGQVFDSQHIMDIIWGIEDRGVMSECDALLSGYMGDASTGEAILFAWKKIKKANPSAIYCCDPVMGDIGRGFFVRPGILELLRDYVVCEADIITPNLFELEALTDMKVNSYEEAKKACQMLHKKGPKIIIVTSFHTENNQNENIEMLLSTKEGMWSITTPYLPIETPPNGAGDAVSALFLGFYLKLHDPVKAFEKMTMAIFSIFEETYKKGTRELQLIGAQDKFLKPECHFRSQKVL